MKDFLMNNIVPLVATGVFGILTKMVAPVGAAAIDFLLKKRELAEAEIRATGHESDVTTAWETWYEIDEKFRITDKVETFLGSKADEFNNLMLQKIPGLSQETLDSLRQAIAGEVNKGKKAVLDQSSILKQLQDSNASLQTNNSNLQVTNASLQDANAQLVAKNAELESRLAQIQSAIASTVSVSSIPIQPTVVNNDASTVNSDPNAVTSIQA